MPVFLLTEKKKNFFSLPEIISDIRKFPLIVSSNVRSQATSLPFAGQGEGGHCGPSVFSRFLAAKEVPHPHEEPASLSQSSIMSGWAGRAKMLVIFYDTKYETALQIQKNRWFPKVCLRLLPVDNSLQNSALWDLPTKPYQAWHLRRECFCVWNKFGWACPSSRLATNGPAKFCRGVAILILGSILQSPGLGHSSQVPFLCTTLEVSFFPSLYTRPRY